MIKPTTLDAIPLTKTIYERSAVGCCLHILLDDQNIDDSHVIFCLEEALKNNHEDCIRLSIMLLKMSKTQRLKVANDADRCW